MLDKTTYKKSVRIRAPKDKEFRLDIGCGERKQDGHIGIDIAPCPGVDHVMDIRKYPWPIDDGVVDGIYTSHFFEHLDGPERVDFMNECWRVLKPGAQIVVICPYWSSMRAVGDPYHKWPPVCEWTFLYFVEGWRIDNKLTHYPITCNFNWSYGYALDPEIAATKSEGYQTERTRFNINVVNDIHVTLTKLELGKR